MIPMHKLAQLSRSLKLRKAASLAGGAEFRLCSTGKLPPEEAEYLAKAAELIAGEPGLSVSAKDALLDSGRILSSAGQERKDLRRALNTIYHVIKAETGHYPSDWDFIEASGALDLSQRRPFPGMQVYLEDIRSPFNVGAMFRAAESFGAEKIWLSPLCAGPRHKRSLRTAMGCVDILPWERLEKDPFEKPDAGEGEFGGIFTMETGGTPLPEFSFPPRGVLIAGSEELGVSPRALAAADASLGRVTIPSYGAKASLNVSVAFGIIMQAWAEKLSLDSP